MTDTPASPQLPPPNLPRRRRWWPGFLDPVLDPNGDGLLGPISTGAGIFLGLCVVAMVGASVTLAVTDTSDLTEQGQFITQIIQWVSQLGIAGGVGSLYLKGS